MTDREVNLSELHGSIVGKKLLNFATDVNASIRIDDSGGKLTAHFGGPNKVSALDKGQKTELTGTGKDLDSALSSLFNAAKEAPLIKSEASKKGNLTFIGRCQYDGHFTTRGPRY